MLIDTDDIIYEIDFKINNLKRIDVMITTPGSKEYMKGCIKTLEIIRVWLLGEEEINNNVDILQ